MCSDATTEAADDDPMWRQLVEGIPQLVWASRADGSIDFLSQRWGDYTGRSCASQLGDGWLQVVHPQDRKRITNVWRSSVASERPYNAHDYRLRRHDGQYRWFDVQAMPVRAADGRVVRWVGASTDVQQRRLLLRSLSESEQRFEQLVEHAPDLFLLHDAKGRLLDANARACAQLGYSLRELRGMAIDTLLGDAPTYAPAQWTALAPGATLTFECVLHTRDDRDIPVEVRLGSHLSRARPRYFLLARDISARREAAAQLHEQAQLLDLAPVTTSGSDERILYWSKGAEQLYGYNAQEALGQTLRSLLAIDGHEFPSLQGLNDNKTWRGELHARTRDGSTRLIHSHWVLHHGDIAQPRLLQVHFDLTARRAAEQALAHSREQLRAYVDHLDSAIEQERAHIARELHDELGQRLTALKFDLRWMSTQFDTREVPSSWQQRIEGMTDLIDDTIREVRALSGELRPQELELLGLAAVIEDYAAQFRTRTGIGCALHLESHKQVPVPHKLAVFRVFQEAMTNVARHSRASHVVARLYARDHQVHLEVEDNGIGLPPQEERRKSLGMIGMSERARQLGGTLEVRSPRAGGVTIALVLPIQGHTQ